MPNLRDIKRRIQSVKNTGKITKAMKMVSAAKLRRAQASMLQARSYADKINSVIASLSEGVDRELHPLLYLRPRKVVEVVVLTSDKGLCGAFNSNILKAAEGHIHGLKNGGFEVSISSIGRKARDYFTRRSVTLRNLWVDLSGKTIVYSTIQEIANDVIENYINETIDEVFLIYNEFQSVMVQSVKKLRLLPIEPSFSKGGQGDFSDEQEKKAVSGFIFEPSESVILNRLLPKNIETQIYSSLLESNASEEAARMVAMENATKNTNELVDKLTLQFNKARQASITSELMDIVGGAAAISE